MMTARHFSRRSSQIHYIIGIVATAASIAGPLSAGTYADAAKIACKGVRSPDKEVTIPLVDLAEAVVIASGFSPRTVMRKETAIVIADQSLTPQKRQEKLDDALIEIVFKSSGNAFYPIVVSLFSNFSNAPAETEKALKLRIAPSPPNDRTSNWFYEERKSIKLTCLPGKQDNYIIPATEGVILGSEQTPIPKINFGKDIKDLSEWSADESRKSGTAATIAFVRTREKKTVDEEIKTTETIKANVDATLGIRITDKDKLHPGFLYASYRLAEVRKTPPDALEDGKSESDEDVNALEIGIAQSPVPIGKAGKISASVSHIFNFNEKFSDRFAARAEYEPPIIGNIVICGLGQSIVLGKLKSTCYLGAAIEYGNITREGTDLEKVGDDDFSGYGDFLATGFVVGIDMVPHTNSSGFNMSIRYRYMPVISGKSADIDRLDVSVAYRWWISERLALELGPTYRHGIEIKSLKIEDELNLSFGILF